MDETRICPTCGEPNEATRTLCWICRFPLDADRARGFKADLEAGRTPLDAVQRRPLAEPKWGTLGALMFAAGVVSLGAFLLAPGLGILLAIVSVIPITRTVMVVNRRVQTGDQPSGATTAALFLSSMAVTSIVLGVVTVLGVGTFCFTCLAVASTGGFRESTVGLGVFFAIPVAGTVVGLVGWQFWKWIRRRWERDMNV